MPREFKPPADNERCVATTRKGTRCPKYRVRGATVCLAHGAKAPQVRAAAARRVAAQDLATRLGIDASEFSSDPKAALTQALLVAQAWTAEIWESESTWTMRLAALRELVNIASVMVRAQISSDAAGAEEARAEAMATAVAEGSAALGAVIERAVRAAAAAGPDGADEVLGEYNAHVRKLSAAKEAS